ncbi:8310_t:CDS:2, partial [Gigaspora rosea]
SSNTILNNNETNNVDSTNIFAPYAKQNELNINLPENRLNNNSLQLPIPNSTNQLTFLPWTPSDNDVNFAFSTPLEEAQTTGICVDAVPWLDNQLAITSS